MTTTLHTPPSSPSTPENDSLADRRKRALDPTIPPALLQAFSSNLSSHDPLSTAESAAPRDAAPSIPTTASPARMAIGSQTGVDTGAKRAAASRPPDVPRGRGFWRRLMSALELNGCGDCKSTIDPEVGEGNCVRKALCQGITNASLVCSRIDDGEGGGQCGRGGGRRFRWGRRRQLAMRSPTEAGPMTLDRIRPGGVGAIREVNGVGVLRRRLLEMGVLPGTKFKVERVAPLGDPIEIRVRGYALSLRRNEAAHILVESDN